MSFVRFFWNQLWLSFFLLVNKEIKRFSRKSKFDGEECLLLQDEHIIVCCVFTFRVDCEMYSFVENEKYFCRGKDGTVCSSFKVNTTSWVLHLTKNVRCFVLVVYFSYRPWYVLLFFDGRNDRCWMVLPFWDTFNIEIDCSEMRLSCLDELLNNDILLSLSFAWYV